MGMLQKLFAKDNPSIFLFQLKTKVWDFYESLYIGQVLFWMILRCNDNWYIYQTYIYIWNKLNLE